MTAPNRKDRVQVRERGERRGRRRARTASNAQVSARQGVDAARPIDVELGSGLAPGILPNPTEDREIKMEPLDYYNDRKYCTACREYVPYLMSTDHSYCAQCGTQVRLFSDADWSAFNESMLAKRKGGRPRKGQDKESA
jgi:hypothetical protein